MFDRTSPPHVLSLVTAAATSALAMNIFLPSLPAIARHFDTDYGIVQLMVSLYLAATAVLQLLCSGFAWREMRDQWDLTGDEIARASVWAVRALLADLKQRGAQPLDAASGPEEGRTE